MASHQVRPTMDLAAGAAVMANDLPLVLAARNAKEPEDLGWKALGKRSLLVPFVGTKDGESEDYLLKLTFMAGREWPPSAQFVNPTTLNYILGEDRIHLPDLRSPEAHVHPEYNCGQTGKPRQLVCCSATYEYYDVLHGGEESILWRTTYDFGVTIDAIGRAFAEHYHGRHPANA